MTMQWYDFVRCGTTLIALTSMYFLGQSWLRNKSQYSVRLKDFWWSINALLIAVAAHSVEQILRDREATVTLLVYFIAVVICLKATLHEEPELFKDRKNARF